MKNRFTFILGQQRSGKTHYANLLKQPGDILLDEAGEMQTVLNLAAANPDKHIIVCSSIITRQEALELDRCTVVLTEKGKAPIVMVTEPIGNIAAIMQMYKPKDEPNPLLNGQCVQLTDREKYIFDGIMAARSVQDFLWGTEGVKQLPKEVLIKRIPLF